MDELFAHIRFDHDEETSIPVIVHLDHNTVRLLESNVPLVCERLNECVYRSHRFIYDQGINVIASRMTDQNELVRRLWVSLFSNRTVVFSLSGFTTILRISMTAGGRIFDLDGHLVVNATSYREEAERRRIRGGT